ncbi:MAG: nuclear transport factor 2 family protein [Acidimicrobiia bacterium]
MDHVQMLWEIEQIKTLKARYFRLMDTQDWAGWTLLFTEDCVATFPRPIGWDHAGEPFTITGRERLGSYLRDLFHDGGRSVHHGHMPEIELMAHDQARGTWAMFDYVDRHDSRKMGYGHYHDDYRRQGAGPWAIAATRLTRLREDDLRSA